VIDDSPPQARNDDKMTVPINTRGYMMSEAVQPIRPLIFHSISALIGTMNILGKWLVFK